MQHDMVVDNQYAAQLRGDINNALQALVGLSEGAAAPTITYANMLWADTTAGLLRKRNSANTAWGIVGSLNGDYSMSFPSGTRMPFDQTNAPTGWTKDTTVALNETAMRIVTGAVGAGGSVAFSTAFSNQSVAATLDPITVNATTLTEAQMPSHTHVVGTNINLKTSAVSGTVFDPVSAGGDIASSATGGGGSHTHSLTMSAHAHTINLDVKYNDFIIASKD